MALFGNKEDKRIRKEKKEAQKKQEEFEAAEKILNKQIGRYVSFDFHSQDWSNTDSTIISIIYRRISEFANVHNLKIVSISKMEEGSLNSITISVIFEREEY